MRNYIVISHAYMAQGVVSSIKMIAGEQIQIDYICGYVDGNENLELKVREKLDSLDRNQETIIFTDLFGGSANNAVLRVAGKRNNVHIIAGMNLALILGILFSPEEGDIEKIIRDGIEEAQNGIVYCNTLENKELEEF